MILDEAANIRRLEWEDLQSPASSAGMADHEADEGGLSEEAEHLQVVSVVDLEALHEQARAEGFELGHAEGLAKAEEILRLKMQELEALLDAAARPLSAMDERTELELARLSITVARQVIATELRLSPDKVIAAIRQAIAQMPESQTRMRVYLHPEDAELVRSLHAAETSWDVLPDAALSRGDCVLKADGARLDARVETRLAAVAAAVLGDEGEARE